jgi:hypothetical protein
VSKNRKLLPSLASSSQFCPFFAAKIFSTNLHAPGRDRRGPQPAVVVAAVGPNKYSLGKRPRAWFVPRDCGPTSGTCLILAAPRYRLYRSYAPPGPQARLRAFSASQGHWADTCPIGKGGPSGITDVRCLEPFLGIPQRRQVRFDNRILYIIRYGADQVIHMPSNQKADHHPSLNA